MATFYVSPTGSDTNTGASETSAFATLERAQEAMRSSGSADTTYLTDGTYILNQPITLTAADSGSSFQAAPGAHPTVSGGEAVTDWTQGANGVWTAHVDADQVVQLTVDGVRQTESRFPDVDPNDPVRGGWLWGADLPAGNDPARSMAFNPSDYPPGHAPQVGEQVTVFSENGYANDKLTIASVNGNVMTFTSDANYDLGPASRYYVSEPTPDSTGEWSFNPDTHTISYLAPEGFTGQGAVASGEQSLFVVNGADNVSIRGITMANTALTSGDPTHAAIEAHDVSNLTVDSNSFVNVGAGVVLHGDSTGNSIANNDFSHIWSSSVSLQPETSGNQITGNTIDHSNDTFVQFGAIDMQESANNTISHNTISNVPRFGISETNYDPGIASGNNTIDGNTINHSGQATPDVGAIYLFSSDDPGAAGDTISNNHIFDAGGVNTHDGGFVAGNDMSSGIYLDNMASNANIFGNTVDGTAFSGILIHGGSNNSIHDNTLADNGKYGISTIAVEGTPITGNETFNNVISVSGDGSNTIDTDQTDPGLIHNNTYYSASGEAPTVADLSLASFQAEGGDIGSHVTSDASVIASAMTQPEETSTTPPVSSPAGSVTGSSPVTDSGATPTGGTDASPPTGVVTSDPPVVDTGATSPTTTSPSTGVVTTSPPVTPVSDDDDTSSAPVGQYGGHHSWGGHNFFDQVADYFHAYQTNDHSSHWHW